MIAKILIVAFVAFFAGLLAYITFQPLMSRSKKTAAIKIHPDIKDLQEMQLPQFKRVGIALDFSEADQKLILHGLGQGNSDSSFFLLHVVESASASLLGKESNDFETNNDKERLATYVKELTLRGMKVEGYLGFNHRSAEIVRLAKELEVDMLVMGAHRHSGLKDILYGETVNTVRHELTIPVLIVNL